jgi:hypothetical protein
MSKALFIWMQVRLIMLGNLILISIGITAIIFIVGGFKFEFSTIAMAMTYAILFSFMLNDLIMFLS